MSKPDNSLGGASSPDPKLSGIDWSSIISEDSENATGSAWFGDEIDTVRYESDLLVIKLVTGTSLVSVSSRETASTLTENQQEPRLPFPAEVNRVDGQDPAVMCLAPGYWNLFSEFLNSEQLLEHVRALQTSPVTAVVDFSAAHCVLRVAGDAAPWLLNKLGGMDFLTMANEQPACCRTRLEHAAVTVHYHKPGGHRRQCVFDLIINRSYVSYLWSLLLASAPHAEELFKHHGNPK